MEITEVLKDCQRRIKVLQTHKDKVNGELAVEENKLKEAQEELVELGIDPGDLTADALEDLADKLESELQAKLEELTKNLEKAEHLVAKYNEL